MGLNLRLKLFLTLLLVAFAVVAVMFLVMQWSFERGFVRLVGERQQEQVQQVVERLAAEYAQTGSWSRVQGSLGAWVSILYAGRLDGHPRGERILHRLSRAPPGVWPPERVPRGGERGRHGAQEREDAQERQDEAERRRAARPGATVDPAGAPPPRALERRMMLLDADRTLLVGRASDVPRLNLNPIRAGGRDVGFLGVVPGPELEALEDIRFLNRQKRTFVAIAAGVVLLAGLVALPLAGAMSGRLRRLAEAARALAAGRYRTRVSVGGRDELGRLAVDFNALAAALERTEDDRRQWVVDISHELRTPLAVLRAELEALQDGVRSLDRQAVDALLGDVLRLGRLVDDLYHLARSDLGALSYHKRDLDIVPLLRDDLAAMANEFRERNISVDLDQRLSGACRVHADPDRLSQLVRNLLTNCARYTDPGGRLVVRLSRLDGCVVLDFEDTAPGVPAADLPLLFERFHRVERSRSRDHGGAGLGLAICRNIAAAHGGHIEARASALGGLWVRVSLPVAA